MTLDKRQDLYESKEYIHSMKTYPRLVIIVKKFLGGLKVFKAIFGIVTRQLAPRDTYRRVFAFTTTNLPTTIACQHRNGFRPRLPH